MKGESSRRLFAYFLESSAWKKYYADRVMNYAYWTNEDPDRARRMFAQRSQDNSKIGITVEEYLYDMLECIHSSSLKQKTKQRLYEELDKLEEHHANNNALKQVI